VYRWYWKMEQSSWDFGILLVYSTHFRRPDDFLVLNMAVGLDTFPSHQVSSNTALPSSMTRTNSYPGTPCLKILRRWTELKKDRFVLTRCSETLQFISLVCHKNLPLLNQTSSTWLQHTSSHTIFLEVSLNVIPISMPMSSKESLYLSKPDFCTHIRFLPCVLRAQSK
jgi:hypothetical protein